MHGAGHAPPAPSSRGPLDRTRDACTFRALGVASRCPRVVPVPRLSRADDSYRSAWRRGRSIGGAISRFGTRATAGTIAARRTAVHRLPPIGTRSHDDFDPISTSARAASGLRPAARRLDRACARRGRRVPRRSVRAAGEGRVVRRGERRRFRQGRVDPLRWTASAGGHRCRPGGGRTYSVASAPPLRDPGAVRHAPPAPSARWGVLHSAHARRDRSTARTSAHRAPEAV